MREYHAKKRFGQNFLVSQKIIEHVVDIISPKPDETIVEIGSGRGALTIPLAESGCRLWAIEFDRDLIDFLQEKLDQFPHVTLMAKDFLALHPELYDLERFVLVGNLPYNITSPVIDWCVRYRERIVRAHFMVQKELAARLTATPKTHDWSPLSILAQMHFDITYCFDVPPQAFVPAPEVESAVVTMRPITVRSDVDMAALEKVVRSAFRQRRKQLINNIVPDLVPVAQMARELIRAIGAPDNCRAEELSIDQFCRLAQLVGTKE